MIRPTPLVEKIPASTPFIGPERLMRENRVDEIVRLGANESMFGPSPKAIAAMSAELERLAWYGDPDNYDLRVALATQHTCDIDEIVVTAGIDDLMALTARAFVAPGAVAVTSRGTYPTFEYPIVGHGGQLERVDYRADGRIDLHGLLERVRATNAPLVYLANPDNPSGTFLPRSEIERFYEALPRSTVFFLDEAYVEYADEGDILAPVPEKLGGLEDRLIRARTFSKVYGMAGARIGYAVTSRKNVEIFQKIRLHFGVNRNAQIGALAALQDIEFKNYVIAETARGREEYYAVARELGLPYLQSATNFVCIDLGSAERATAVLQELFKRGVWIRKPGAPPLDRFIRVSVGTQPMREAFAAALRNILATASV